MMLHNDRQALQMTGMQLVEFFLDMFVVDSHQTPCSSEGDVHVSMRSSREADLAFDLFRNAHAIGQDKAIVNSLLLALLQLPGVI